MHERFKLYCTLRVKLVVNYSATHVYWLKISANID